MTYACAATSMLLFRWSPFRYFMFHYITLNEFQVMSGILATLMELYVQKLTASKALHLGYQNLR